MKEIHVVSLVLLISLAKSSGISLSQTLPSYSPVCPGDDVVFTCIGNGAIFWSTGSGVIQGFINPNNSMDFILEIFKVSLISVVNNSYTSTATAYNININQTNELIECSEDTINFHSGTITVIQDLGDFLPPTGLSLTAVNSSTVLLSWSPLVTDHPMCIAGYTITHDNTQFNISNITTFIKSDLSQGNNSFTINGRDKKGTLGETSDTVTIDLSVPSNVINLQNFVIYDETCAVTIILIWEHPDKAHRPPVIKYDIYHNITSPDSHVTTMNITQYMISNISCGYTYYFSISPENVVGIGENTTIYVQVQEYTNSSISSSVAIEVSKTVIITQGISGNNVSHTATSSVIKTKAVSKIISTQGSMTDTKAVPLSVILASMTKAQAVSSSSAILTSTQECTTNDNQTLNIPSIIGIIIGMCIFSCLISATAATLFTTLYFRRRGNGKSKSATENKVSLPGPVYDEISVTQIRHSDDFPIATNPAYGTSKV